MNAPKNTPTMDEMVAAVRAHAVKNYTDGVSDIIAETMDRDDIVAAIGKARTLKGAVRNVRRSVSDYAEYRADICATAF